MKIGLYIYAIFIGSIIMTALSVFLGVLPENKKEIISLYSVTAALSVFFVWVLSGKKKK